MDPGGLEKYKALSKNFYKESFVVVLVYEIINKKSFDAIKNYWYKEAINCSSTQYFFVVGNKCDLYKNQQVSDVDGKKYAKEINGSFKINFCFFWYWD